LKNAAEAPPSSASRVFRTHTSPKILFDEHLDMRSELFFEVFVETTLAKEPANP
jgi:hypothetical protein